MRRHLTRGWGPPAAALLLALLVPALLHGLAPFLDWHTIESACCDIHYPRRLHRLALRVAPIADEAHATVVQFLGSTPSDRVQIVIEDESDSANGWALTVPYNTVHLNAVAPDNYSALGDSDDWVRSLVLHEYTHIVHLDAVGGIPRDIQRLTGKLWSPNHVQPPWFIEGVAIYAESRFTSGGRVRASLHDMHLRTAALAGTLLTLDELSTGTRRWPHGAPWLYGGRFLDFIAQRYGEDIFRRISARYGSQLVPYGLNRAAEGVIDRSYDQLYAEFVDSIRTRATRRRARVRALGPDRSRRLTSMGETVRRPVVAPGGALYFFADPRDEAPGLYRLDDDGPARLLELNGFGGATALPDGRVIVAQPEIFDNAYAYHDLYELDPHRGLLRRLTHGIRAKSPAVSPSGRFVVFVRRDADACALSRLELATGEVTDLVRLDDGSQFYTPAVAPDSSSVVVGMWRPGGYRDLWRVDLSSGALTALTRDRAIDLDPAFAPSGTRVLFSSDRSGIFNIYSVDLSDGTTIQLSNVVSGAFAPAPDSTGAGTYFLGYTADGYDLFLLPAGDEIRLPAAASYERPLPAPTPPPISVARARYNPLPSLLPRSWTPLMSGSFSGPVIGAAVEGQDAVAIHQYALQSTWSSASGAVNLSAGYGYNDLPAPLRVTVGRFDGERPVLLEPTSEPVIVPDRSWRAEVALVWPALRWTRSHWFGAAYGVEYSEPLSLDGAAPDAQLPAIPWRGRTCAARFFWSYRDTRRFLDSISTERGTAMSLSMRIAHPAIGSERAFLELFGDGSLFLQVPGLSGHVAVVMLQGGAAFGPRSQRRLYSLGGLPDRNVVEDLLYNLRIGGGYLRGFPSAALVGDGFLLGSLEYRWPLLELQRGVSTLPIFFDRLSAVAFGDMGGTYIDTPRADNFLHRAIGVELRTDFVLGFHLPVAVRLGVARGLDEPGLEVQPYLVLGTGY